MIDLLLHAIDEREAIAKETRVKRKVKNANPKCPVCSLFMRRRTTVRGSDSVWQCPKLIKDGKHG